MDRRQSLIGRRAQVLATSFALGIAAFASVSASANDVAAMGHDEILSLQRRLSDAGCYKGAFDGQAGGALDAAIKACPDQDPVLRIETGMHTASIKRIGVDAACRLAATGSEDKTVRLWSLPDGKPLRTQRLPIGNGNAGKIYAVAVSPDGRWVAAGWDSFGVRNNKHTVYVFDSAGGASMRRLGMFDTVPFHLAFSPDGRSLAVALAVRQGVRILDTATGRELMADRDFTGPSTAVAFSPEGALYAIAFDGFIRRYGPDHKRTAKVAAPGGRRLTSLALNPTGNRIAVAYEDTAAVDLFDAASLRHLGAAETSDIGTGNLHAVAWLPDGRGFLAGGNYVEQFDGSPRVPIRIFDANGQRRGADVPISNLAVMSLVPCAKAIAFSTVDPSFGLVDLGGAVTTLGRGPNANMFGKSGNGFLVADDGMRVRFGLDAGGRRAVLFDLAAGTLVDSPRPPADLRPADERSLQVENWQSHVNPTLDGRPLQLPNFERSRSLAIRPTRDGFVLGSDARLYAFTAGGAELWRILAPSGAVGVNLARSGELVVAAYSDGTIRWHRWSDGKELLALFVHREDKRWVAWTPTGYYMASPGAEDLIGWHVNRGWEQPADFFPASRFRERFNRPDIVQLVLQTLDEEEAVKRANETARRKEDATPLIGQLPPVIRVTAPGDGSRFTTAQVTLGYDWRSPSGLPVDRVDVLVDGRPLKAFGLAAKPVSSGETVAGTLSVSLPARDVEVALIAHAGDLASEPARLKLVWSGATQSPEALLKPKLYALVIGVSAYAAPDLVLQYAAKDARDFAQTLQNQRGGIYGAVETRLLTDHDVTRTSVVRGLEWLEKEVTSRDVGVVFIAGHGYMDEKQTYWFLPADATPEEARVTGIAQDDLSRTLRGLAGKALLFLDTCHAAGALSGGTRRGTVDINSVVNELASTDNGVITFASSTGREDSVERSDWQNGAFTKALVEGVRDGRADLLHKGTITLSLLNAYVVDRVKELTGGIQHPVMTMPPTVPDFPIAVVRR
jgi:hypothetical protein